MIRSNNITYDGKDYPIKYFNGYYFSTDELYEAMRDTNGDQCDIYEDEETTNIDRMIACFFEEEVFHNMTAEELYEDYNLYS